MSMSPSALQSYFAVLSTMANLLPSAQMSFLMRVKLLDFERQVGGDSLLLNLDRENKFMAIFDKFLEDEKIKSLLEIIRKKKLKKMGLVLQKREASKEEAERMMGQHLAQTQAEIEKMKFELFQELQKELQDLSISKPNFSIALIDAREEYESWSDSFDQEGTEAYKAVQDIAKNKDVGLPAELVKDVIMAKAMAAFREIQLQKLAANAESEKLEMQKPGNEARLSKQERFEEAVSGGERASLVAEIEKIMLIERALKAFQGNKIGAEQTLKPSLVKAMARKQKSDSEENDAEQQGIKKAEARIQKIDDLYKNKCDQSPALQAQNNQLIATLNTAREALVVASAVRVFSPKDNHTEAPSGWCALRKAATATGTGASSKPLDPPTKRKTPFDKKPTPPGGRIV